MFKQFLLIFFYLLQFDFTFQHEQNTTEVGSYYFDLETGRPLCGELIPNERRPEAKIIFRRIPCSCGNLSCGCCAGINLSNLNFKRKACTKFTYSPYDFAIDMEVTMNDKQIYRRQFSAKNPPPICVPIPYVPFITFCVRFFNVFTPGYNMHACIDFETRMANHPVLILHFDCFRIGVDGIAWLEPEDNGGLDNLPVVIDNRHDDASFPSDNTTHPGNENEYGFREC